MAACAGGAGLGIDPVQSETGNYCVDQAKSILQETFGPDTKITQAKMMSGYGQWSLWVRSNVSKDWIVFHPTGMYKDSICTTTAYISAPKILSTMWGYGDAADPVAKGTRPGPSSAESR